MSLSLATIGPLAPIPKGYAIPGKPIVIGENLDGCGRDGRETRRSEARWLSASAAIIRENHLRAFGVDLVGARDV
jgi:hypothetical protein